MKFRRRESQHLSKIDLTPLIDVMFILNIVFLLNAQTATQGLKLNLPKSSTGQNIKINAFVIMINDLNQIIVDGKVISSDDLEKHLKTLNNETPIILKADREASYGKSIEVFDSLRSAEFNKISLETIRKK